MRDCSETEISKDLYLKLAVWFGFHEAVVISVRASFIPALHWKPGELKTLNDLFSGLCVNIKLKSSSFDQNAKPALLSIVLSEVCAIKQAICLLQITIEDEFCMCVRWEFRFVMSLRFTASLRLPLWITRVITHLVSRHKRYTSSLVWRPAILEPHLNSGPLRFVIVFLQYADVNKSICIIS